jgi:hypothetical protein
MRPAATSYTPDSARFWGQGGDPVRADPGRIGRAPRTGRQNKQRTGIETSAPRIALCPRPQLIADFGIPVAGIRSGSGNDFQIPFCIRFHP